MTTRWEHFTRNAMEKTSGGDLITDTGLLQASLGQYGGKCLDATVGPVASTPDTGYVFVAVQVLSDATMTLTGNITDMSGISLLAGDIVYGRFTNISLSSGIVICYNGV